MYGNTKTNNMNNQLTTIKDYLGKPTVNTFIQSILGEKANKFATNLVQVVNQNEMLKNADHSSVLNSAIMATMLDLNLNPSFGHAYIVPFNNRQKDGSFKVMAQFMLGYKGLKQLAIRSGQFKTIDTKRVFEGQYVEDDSFIGYHFDWKNKQSDKVVGYACRFELITGFEKTMFMTVDELKAHGKKYSKTFEHANGQWKQNFDGMCMKTVTKLCLNSGEAPLSIEMQNAVIADQAIINDVETLDVDYIDSDEAKPELAKPLFTESDFDMCKNAGMTIDEIRKDWETTPELEMSYNDYIKA